MTIETISIKDWIESDFAKSLESEESFEKWKLFEIVPSNGLYEVYITGRGHEEVKNIMYVIGNQGFDIDILKSEMGKTLIALRDSAIAEKIEGEAIGVGALIIQNRMDVEIGRDAELQEGKYKGAWRGVMKRMDVDYKHIPRR